MTNKDLELDEITEKWLRENDPDYFKKNKGYHSQKSLEKKSKKEIPISSLSKKVKSEIQEQLYGTFTKKGEDRK